MQNRACSGKVKASEIHLGLTLGSGQVFRWGRDVDGWWKGIAYGVVFHLMQEDDEISYRASAGSVNTYAGHLSVEDFLRWYLRLDEMPRIRVARDDRYLRKARDLLKGLQFVRQDPFECIVSYVLSVQAHMSLTKKRIGFIAKTLGYKIELDGQTFWTFPKPDELAELDSGFYRRSKFGWRSERVTQTVCLIADTLEGRNTTLAEWRSICNELHALSGSGVGIKVAKCIDLFSLERLHAVPVDTWVRKFAEEWYGITSSDEKICRWGEEKWGKWAGYCNEYLFSYYRELHGQTVHDRVISFNESEEPSAVMPYEA